MATIKVKFNWSFVFRKWISSKTLGEKRDKEKEGEKLSEVDELSMKLFTGTVSSKEKVTYDTIVLITLIGHGVLMLDIRQPNNKWVIF